jgi:hypothetical protein
LQRGIEGDFINAARIYCEVTSGADKFYTVPHCVSAMNDEKLIKSFIAIPSLVCY